MLHQYGKRAKTNSQKVFGDNSYVCRNYGGKTARGETFCSPHPPPPPILNSVKKETLQHCSKRIFFYQNSISIFFEMQ